MSVRRYDVDGVHVPLASLDDPEPTILREQIFQKGQSKRIWGELYKVVDSSDVVVQVRTFCRMRFMSKCLAKPNGNEFGSHGDSQNPMRIVLHSRSGPSPLFDVQACWIRSCAPCDSPPEGESMWRCASISAAKRLPSFCFDSSR